MDAENRIRPHTDTGAINEANVHVAVVGGANDVAFLHRAALLGFGFLGAAFNFGFANSESNFAYHLGGLDQVGKGS